jgi:hypothetical protein
MSTQISLSLELISLLSWLLKHEKTALSNLVRNALEHGFAEEIDQIDNTVDNGVNEDLYNTVLDFLDYLEDNLIKNLENIQVDHKTKDTIMPTIQKLEGDSLDYKTLWMSMQQTKARMNKATRKEITAEAKSVVTEPSLQATEPALQAPKNANEILFEQLLKNWKPRNKETLN